MTAANITLVVVILGTIGVAYGWVVHRKNVRSRVISETSNEITTLRKDISEIRRAQRNGLSDAVIRNAVRDLDLGLAATPLDSVREIDAAIPARAVPSSEP
jgi:hypothetical protein